MPSTVVEIVTYTVRNPETAERARRRAHDTISAYPGFVAWTRYASVLGDRRFVDHVEWQSLDHALAAQQAFMSDARTAAFRSEIDAVLAVTHVVNRSVQPATTCCME